MEGQQFQALVARVERLAETDPKGYVRRVLAIAALGFVILGLVIAMALVNVALIGGVVLLVVFTGGRALLFFAKLGKLVIVFAIPVWLMLRTTWTLVFARLPRPEGREIRRDEAAMDRLGIAADRPTLPLVRAALQRLDLRAGAAKRIPDRPRFGRTRRRRTGGRRADAHQHCDALRVGGVLAGHPAAHRGRGRAAR